MITMLETSSANDERISIGDASAAGLRTLDVTLPSSVVASGAVEVRVRSASGQRELRDQVEPTQGGREVTLELPSGLVDAGESPGESAEFTVNYFSFNPFHRLR